MLKHSTLSSSGISKPQYASGKGLKKRNLKQRKRPAWDSTVNDLSALKSTPEELDRRRRVHRSQNMDLVKQEQLRKHVSKLHQERMMESSLQSTRCPSRKPKDLQSVSSNNIFDALETSDRLMAAVKDLLGDHTKKYQGLPHVTRAPHHSDLDRSLPEMAEVISQLDLNSELVMDKSALNDVDDDQNSFASTNSSRDGCSSFDGFYQPKMDLDRFKQLIREAELDRMIKPTNSATLDSNIPATSAQNIGKRIEFNGIKDQKMRRKPETRKVAAEGCQGGSARSEGRDGHQSGASMMERGGGDGLPTMASPRTQAAMNDSVRVERMRSALTENNNINNNSNQAATQMCTMDDFNQMLEAIQVNLAQRETLTGSVSSFESSQRPSSYTGYTRALLETMARMSSHMAQSEMRSRADRAASEELLCEVNRLNGLVDGLTADIIAMQEEYSRLKNDFVKHKRDTEIHWMLLSQSLTPYGIHIQLPIQPPPMAYHSEAAGNSDGYSKSVPSPVCISSSAQQRPVSRDSHTRQVVTNTSAAEGAGGLVDSEQTLRNGHPLTEHHRRQDGALHHQRDTVRSTAADDPSVVVHRGSPAVDSTAAASQLLGYADLHDQQAFDTRREEIRRQMVELNRQRQLAQSKVDELKRKSLIQKVSPSISPITVSSEPSAIEFTNRPTQISRDGAQVVTGARQVNRLPQKRIDVKMPAITDDFDVAEQHTFSSQNTSQNKQLVQDNLWL